MQERLKKNLYRIIDANSNRAVEGLRVCEDCCRFVFEDKAATKKYKDLRHALCAVIARIDLKQRVGARDSRRDIGRPTTTAETKRRNVKDIYCANAQRVKESVRVLEECTKVLNCSLAEDLKSLRYRAYSLEKAVIKKIVR